MVYNSGQAAVLFPHLDRLGVQPAWFILGGPADADEAQTVRARYPDIQVIASEPCDQFRRWQREAGFPGTLLPFALSDREHDATLVVPRGHPRGATMVRHEPGAPGCDVELAQAITLDRLSDLYGPFQDAVLWLDIEGMELPALRGAEGMFAAGAVLLASVEVMVDERPDDHREVGEFFTRHGFHMAEEWERTPIHQDQIWVREEPAPLPDRARGGGRKMRPWEEV
jgi:FkbM family methyltransferase